MKREELADFIIKNLVFLLIFIVFSFSISEHLLLPKIQAFQEEKNQLRHAQFFQTKTQKQNEQIQNQIQTLKLQNQSALDTLQKNVTSSKLQTIARDFFNVLSIKQEKKNAKDEFLEILFKVEAKSNGIKAIFDFMSKLQAFIPNATLILPLEIEKRDPLTNSLNITFSIKITQLKNAQ